MLKRQDVLNSLGALLFFAVYILAPLWIVSVIFARDESYRLWAYLLVGILQITLAIALVFENCHREEEQASTDEPEELLIHDRANERIHT